MTSEIVERNGRELLWARLKTLGIKRTVGLDRLLEEIYSRRSGPTSTRKFLCVQLPLWPSMAEPYVSGILVTAGPLLWASTVTDPPEPSTSDPLTTLQAG